MYETQVIHMGTFVVIPYPIMTLMDKCSDPHLKKLLSWIQTLQE